MNAVIHSTTAGGGSGSFLRFPISGDRQNHQNHRRNLSFRTWATVQGKQASSTSLYQLLEISSSDGQEEVKKAYKRLARKYHPDVSPPDRTEDHTKIFIEVQEAYETLSDPQRRAEYDRRIARGMTRLGFSGRTRHFDQEMETSSEWRSRWKDQISELKRRSHEKSNDVNNISDENLSWAARMRRKREEASNEL